MKYEVVKKDRARCKHILKKHIHIYVHKYAHGSMRELTGTYGNLRKLTNTYQHLLELRYLLTHLCGAS